ncbi:VanW family protein [Peptococcaceae bacterium 1198_IL3148]
MIKRSTYITPLICLLLFMATFVFVGEDIKILLSTQHILPGIKVKGIDIGGLNKQQTAERLNQLEKEILQIPVNLVYNNQTWSLPLEKVGLQIDIDQTITRAMQMGRQGSISERWQTYRRIKEQGYTVQPLIKINQQQLVEEVNKLVGHLNVPAKNAVLNIDDDDKITIIPSKNGKEIDMEILQRNLQQQPLAGKGFDLLLPLVEVMPEYTTEDIQEMGITGLLASYTTKFDPKITNRSYNIRVAANALDGLIITPGQEVSFNEVVGPRSSEAGYKTAGVIENNELVEGVGGGVCQVSTTLYNAVLLADLEISERRNHSLPINYVPIGRDATVVYGLVDFKFINNSGRCLYLKTEVKSGQLTVKIFGDSSQRQQVIVNSWIEQELEPETIYEEDNNLKRGQKVIKQEGSKGYVVNVEKIVLKNGEVIKRQQLPISRYNPVNEVIAVGTADQERVITPPRGIDFEATSENN